MNESKYIGLDVHQATISAVVLDSVGKLVMESILETKAATVLQFFHGLRGSLHVTFEEGTCAAWLHDLLKPHVNRVLVCDPRKNALLKSGNKNDPVTQDLTRVMNRLKALYRSWAIPCGGDRVYAPRHRGEWLAKISEPGVRRRAEFYYQQLDALRALHHQVRHDLLAESRKQEAIQLLRQIPSIGPIRAALLAALIQTPHRFRTKRQLWAYSGMALKTYASGEYRFIGGQLQGSKKLAIRGLNANHNHDLKNIFKGAATRAAAVAGPLQDFYAALVAKGMKPSLARLTLARKIAAITLLVWKKGVRFDAEHLKQQAA